MSNEKLAALSARGERATAEQRVCTNCCAGMTRIVCGWRCVCGRVLVNMTDTGGSLVVKMGEKR